MSGGFSYCGMVGPRRFGAGCSFEGPDFGHESGEVLLLKRGGLLGLC